MKYKHTIYFQGFDHAISVINVLIEHEVDFKLDFGKAMVTEEAYKRLKKLGLAY